MIALLAPLLLPLAQAGIGAIGRLIAGDQGERVADRVVDVVREVTGSTEPADVQAALADPAIAGELAVRIGQIEADVERARIAAALADTQDARAMARGASGSISWLAIGAMLVTLYTFGMLTVALWALLSADVPEQNRDLVNILVGAIIGMAGASATFWVGSSIGSASKSGLVPGIGHGR